MSESVAKHPGRECKQDDEAAERKPTASDFQKTEKSVKDFLGAVLYGQRENFF